MSLSWRFPTAALVTSLLTASVVAGGCQNWFRGDVDQSIPLPLPSEEDAATDGATDPPLVSPEDAPGVGDACDDESLICRQGLACIDGACRAIGTSTEEQTCLLSDECTEGLVCGLGGRCELEGPGTVGTLCVSPSGCQKGTVCASTGFYGTCVTTGTSDLGDPCEASEDCYGGLYCTSDGICSTPSPFYGYEGWGGATCSKTEGVGNFCSADAPCEEGLTCEESACVDNRPPRVYFELGHRDDGDFFRLPFPSDTRLTESGTIDLTHFPTPGGGLDGRDAVAGLVDAVGAGQQGFSTTPSVLFRFSDSMDLGSFRGKEKDGKPATLRYVNIEPDSIARGYGPSFNWYVTTGGGRYVCPRWTSIRTAPETPLRPGEQYATLLLRGVSTANGEEFEREDELGLLLGTDPPSDPTYIDAWNQYANLRSFLADEGIATDDVIGAAVFTPGIPHARIEAIQQAITALPVPAPAQATLCEGAAKSPCDDGLTGDAHVRGCLGSPPGVDEVHFRLELPLLQQGERPYLEPGSGGDIATSADGAVAIATTESVCVSMAISNVQAMPAGGWPLVVIPPDIGDTYRSAVDRMGQLVTGLEHEGTPTGAVVVSWEGPLHGERATTEHAPLARVRNFTNPAAARGNVLQGVGDMSEIIRTMSTIAWTADTSPTGEPLVIDSGRIATVAHGHGATLATLGAPHEDGVGLMVLSGAGANVAATWLDKTEPVEAQVGVALALAETDDEGPMAISKHHPALLRFASYMNSVDPVNHAQLLANNPLDGSTTKHVLNILGVPDERVSESAARLFARRLGAPLVGEVLDEISGLEELEAPASNTLGVAGAELTAATIQAATSDGASAHDILFEDAGVQAQVSGFLASWLATTVPTVPERP